MADLQLTLDPLVPPAGVLPHQRLDQRCYLDADGRPAFLVATCPLPPDQKEPGAPDPKVLRQALFAWAFNPATRDITPPPHIAAALDGAERASLAVTYLEDTANVRLALAACATTLAGKPAAGSTQRRKRSVSYNGCRNCSPLEGMRKAAAGFSLLPASRRGGRGAGAADGRLHGSSFRTADPARCPLRPS